MPPVSANQSSPVAVLIAVFGAIAGVALIVSGILMLTGDGGDGAAAPTTTISSTTTSSGASSTTAAPATTVVPPTSEPTTPDTRTYVPITDDTGTISLDIPSDWEDLGTGPWTQDGEDIGPSVNAAEDIDAWVAGWDTPGLFVGVTDRIGFTGAFGDFSADCLADRGENITVGGAGGSAQWWWSCGDGGSSFFVGVVELDGGRIALIQILDYPNELPGVVARVLETLVFSG